MLSCHDVSFCNQDADEHVPDAHGARRSNGTPSGDGDGHAVLHASRGWRRYGLYRRKPTPPPPYGAAAAAAAAAATATATAPSITSAATTAAAAAAAHALAGLSVKRWSVHATGERIGSIRSVGFYTYRGSKSWGRGGQCPTEKTVCLFY